MEALKDFLDWKRSLARDQKPQTIVESRSKPDPQPGSPFLGSEELPGRPRWPAAPSSSRHVGALRRCNVHKIDNTIDAATTPTPTTPVYTDSGAHWPPVSFAPRQRQYSGAHWPPVSLCSSLTQVHARRAIKASAPVEKRPVDSDKRTPTSGRSGRHQGSGPERGPRTPTRHVSSGSS